VLALVALVVAAALYAPSLGYGAVNYDDPWLIANNWILHDHSVASLHTIFFDLGRDARATLGAEYLPIRDLSVMADLAMWGTSYAGHHATNLALYLAALALWFAALARFGVPRHIAGLAILIWAVHPSHVESVAWLSERKGLLALAFAGVAALGYASFRSGRSRRWLVLAVVVTVAAVWSKALAAFTIAALGGFELALPGRVSWRRSLSGLAALAITTAIAMIPVLVVATRMHVVTSDVASPGGHGWLAMVTGVHGFYVRAALMATVNSVSYPIDSLGPSTADIVLGGTWLLVAVAVAVAPRLGPWRTPPVARAAALVWLITWFPASRIVLPVRLVVVADRYLLVPSLAVALVVAAGILAIPRRSIGVVLAGAVVLAAAARTLVAESAWRDASALWSRAVTSNPLDGNAWSMYSEALSDTGHAAAADAAIAEGLARTSSPGLQLRRALLLLRRGDHEHAQIWMQRAAEAGEPAAMSNLALMLHDGNDAVGALTWARKAVATSPLYAQGYRVLGKIALEWREHAEAEAAFRRAIELEPRNLENHYNLGLTLVALGKLDEARVEFTRCLASPRVAPLAREQLEKLPK
jgi:Flp pilus assembly protein TadD